MAFCVDGSVVRSEGYTLEVCSLVISDVMDAAVKEGVRWLLLFSDVMKPDVITDGVVKVLMSELVDFSVEVSSVTVEIMESVTFSPMVSFVLNTVEYSEDVSNVVVDFVVSLDVEKSVVVLAVVK